MITPSISFLHGEQVQFELELIGNHNNNNSANDLPKFDRLKLSNGFPKTIFP
jgi:hypothetical protein